MLTNTCFPCWENSSRGFLHSPSHGKRIGCNGLGQVFATENRKGWEEWYVEILKTDEDDQDKTYQIKSKYHNGHFLCSNKEGHVYTCKSASRDTVWCLKKSDHCKRGVFLSSKNHNRQLACNGSQIYTVAHQWKGWETWMLEFSAGELCFMKSTNNRFLSCDPWGKTSLKHNSGGWEVFRFTEVEDAEGSLIISSWTHFPKCIRSSPTGKVWFGDNLGGTWERWVLEKSSIKDGVLLRSLLHGRYLTKTNSNGLSTNINPTSSSVWTFESANRNMFLLFNSSHNKYIETRDSWLHLQGSREKASKWEVVTYSVTNELAFRNIESNQWLSVSDYWCFGASVTVATKDDKKSKWIAKTSSDNGIMLVSCWNRKYLGCNKDSFYLSNHGGSWETWNLQPILPGTITGAQIITPIVATAGAVAFAVAAPFAILGAIGMLGFTAGGIAAGSCGAAMMSAEAIAAGGGIAAGGLVATLQSIGAVGLGAAGIAAAATGGAVVGGSVVGSSYIVSGHIQKSIDSSSKGQLCNTNQNVKNRPVCGWKTW
jgi:Interferon-induced 6-16 family